VRGNEPRRGRPVRAVVGALLAGGLGWGLFPPGTAWAAPLSVSISDASVTEGGSGATTVVTFSLTLSAAASKNVSVSFATSDGAARAPADYLAAAGTATIRRGSRTASISVTVNGDDVYEGDETFTVRLARPRGVALADDVGAGTIIEDEAFPSLSISGSSVIEGSVGATPLTFAIAILPASAFDVSVDYSTSNGTALSPDDYASSSGTLAFPAGSVGAQTVSVDVVGDAASEPTEEFTVTLSNARGGAIGTGSATGVILDDDGAMGASSTTTLSVIKRRTRTVAKGDVTPAHPAMTLQVALYKLKNGAWVQVASKNATLGTAVDPDGDGVYSSAYLTRFRRISGRQKIVARFAGDSDHTASFAVVKFRA
jgi:Calx-beta domain